MYTPAHCAVSAAPMGAHADTAALDLAALRSIRERRPRIRVVHRSRILSHVASPLPSWYLCKCAFQPPASLHASCVPLLLDVDSSADQDVSSIGATIARTMRASHHVLSRFIFIR